MINSDKPWSEHSFLIQATRDDETFYSHTGAASIIRRLDSNRFEVALTVRDSKNRSIIVNKVLNFSNEKPFFEEDHKLAISSGELGMFDENGTSYPFCVNHDHKDYMFYTGWMPSVLTPFQNHLGLAVLEGESWQRVSRAPILPRNNEDPLSIGSCCLLKIGDKWRMWYTSFRKWGVSPDEPKHWYVIKTASSANLIDWQREVDYCVEPCHEGEHSIGRPTVYFDGNLYHMWFSYRGEHYKIGYAYSQDGISWTRDDTKSGFVSSGQDWDSLDQCYPYVFVKDDYLYMLYCGNNYGDAGVGICRKKL